MDAGPERRTPDAGEAASYLVGLVHELLEEAHTGRGRAIQATLDSLARVELLACIERTFSVEMPQYALGAGETLRDLLGAPLAAGPRVKADDVALLQYTSGSTGNPKGVVLTHANLLANLRAWERAARFDSNNMAVSWLPLYHDLGLIGAWLGSVYNGDLLVLMSPLDFLARPARWLWAIHSHRGTASAAPNFAFEIFRLLFCLVALPVQTEGVERLSTNEPRVFVANHTSYLDVLVLIATLPGPLHFVAEREFLRMPVLRTL
jgi:hypothetical protein